MTVQLRRAPLDLMPPGFAEGLEDWAAGDRPEGASYAGAANARLVQDAALGACLELRTVVAAQRLRYMGEVPLPPGGYVEVSARLVAVSGPLPLVRVAAWPGGAGGRVVPGLPRAGRVTAFGVHGRPAAVSAVIGPAGPAVDIAWDARPRYAHVGIDLLGEPGAVVRVERIAVRDVSRRFLPLGPVLPGFEDL